jgi:hypothetical protein
MENSINYSSQYINRLIYYAPRSAVICAALQLIFFKRVTTGFLFGLALGAGYCHKDFKQAFNRIYNFKLISDIEDKLSSTLSNKN